MHLCFFIFYFVPSACSAVPSSSPHQSICRGDGDPSGTLCRLLAPSPSLPYSLQVRVHSPGKPCKWEYIWQAASGSKGMGLLACRGHEQRGSILNAFGLLLSTTSHLSRRCLRRCRSYMDFSSQPIAPPPSSTSTSALPSRKRMASGQLPATRSPWNLCRREMALPAWQSCCKTTSICDGIFSCMGCTLQLLTRECSYATMAHREQQAEGGVCSGHVGPMCGLMRACFNQIVGLQIVFSSQGPPLPPWATPCSVILWPALAALLSLHCRAHPQVPGTCASSPAHRGCVACTRCWRSSRCCSQCRFSFMSPSPSSPPLPPPSAPHAGYLSSWSSAVLL